MLLTIEEGFGLGKPRLHQRLRPGAAPLAADHQILIPYHRPGRGDILIALVAIIAVVTALADASTTPHIDRVITSRGLAVGMMMMM
jgi:hypothetical protein